MPIVVLRVEELAERLDRHLAQELEGVSRSAAQRLIRRGAVLVNSAPAKASYKLETGDVIRVELPEEADEVLLPESVPLRVLYEDEHLLVIDKDADMVVHPGAGHRSGTLVNALLAHRPDIGAAFEDSERPGIVHRLDRDTTGALVVAARPDVRQALQRQFKAHEVEKRYLALVYGDPSPSRGAIEAPIGRHPVHRKRMAVLSEGGRAARTEYTVRERFAQSALVELLLLTGRTHQIRVHLSAIGYPVVGDRVYGPRRERIAAPRQMLHSWRLGFSHPVTGQWHLIETPLAKDMQAVLTRLRQLPLS
jgi:23S rRNA pseudouridine1911/1915/1917 synthase